MAAKPYLGIFWDIQNVNIPARMSPQHICFKIRDLKFAKDCYEKSFVVVCDAKQENSDALDKLNESQVDIVHVSSNTKNAADKKLKILLTRFIRDFKSYPLRIILITGDKDFSNDLHGARNEDNINVEVLLIHPQICTEVLQSFAHKTMLFDFLVRDIPVQGEHYLKVTNIPSTIEDQAWNIDSHRTLTCMAREHKGDVVEWAPENGYCILKFYRNTEAREFKETRFKFCLGERQIQISLHKPKTGYQPGFYSAQERRYRSNSCPRRTNSLGQPNNQRHSSESSNASPLLVSQSRAISRRESPANSRNNVRYSETDALSQQIGAIRLDPVIVESEQEHHKSAEPPSVPVNVNIVESTKHSKRKYENISESSDVAGPGPVVVRYQVTFADSREEEIAGYIYRFIGKYKVKKHKTENLITFHLDMTSYDAALILKNGLDQLKSVFHCCSDPGQEMVVKVASILKEEEGELEFDEIVDLYQKKFKQELSISKLNEALQTYKDSVVSKQMTVDVRDEFSTCLISAHHMMSEKEFTDMLEAKKDKNLSKEEEYMQLWQNICLGHDSDIFLMNVRGQKMVMHKESRHLHRFRYECCCVSFSFLKENQDCKLVSTQAFLDRFYQLFPGSVILSESRCQDSLPIVFDIGNVEIKPGLKELYVNFKKKKFTEDLTRLINLPENLRGSLNLPADMEVLMSLYGFYFFYEYEESTGKGSSSTRQVSGFYSSKPNLNLFHDLFDMRLRRGMEDAVVSGDVFEPNSSKASSNATATGKVASHRDVYQENEVLPAATGASVTGQPPPDLLGSIPFVAYKVGDQLENVPTREGLNRNNQGTGTRTGTHEKDAKRLPENFETARKYNISSQVNYQPGSSTFRVNTSNVVQEAKNPINEPTRSFGTNLDDSATAWKSNEASARERCDSAESLVQQKMAGLKAREASMNFLRKSKTSGIKNCVLEKGAFDVGEVPGEHKNAERYPVSFQVKKSRSLVDTKRNVFGEQEDTEQSTCDNQTRKSLFKPISVPAPGSYPRHHHNRQERGRERRKSGRTSENEIITQDQYTSHANRFYRNTNIRY